ncbi:hypothetical protein BCR34DRAFT_606634 [Clohesyomyces aquaticus]|uniref:Uncharacterized protein n=1 Tax=Clohesyomyces aquaticus TaxID=1231657 RepID=A0A1Y1YN63_9PLEO|nr:hypothetical protein BCR34DRAFT_606634 [Clohesyomyces aquaticus]
MRFTLAIFVAVFSTLALAAPIKQLDRKEACTANLEFSEPCTGFEEAAVAAPVKQLERKEACTANLEFSEPCTGFEETTTT